jgi:hypothetical protein
VLTTAEKMLNDALSTYTYDAENRIATRDVEMSGGFAGADEVEGGGDHRRLGMGAAGAPSSKSFGSLRSYLRPSSSESLTGVVRASMRISDVNVR